MATTFIDNRPPADHRIRELWVWIAIEQDGGEGIVSADLDLAGTSIPRHMPLQSSRRDVAEGLEPLARRTVEAMMATTGRKATLRLEHFIAAPS